MGPKHLFAGVVAALLAATPALAGTILPPASQQPVLKVSGWAQRAEGHRDTYSDEDGYAYGVWPPQRAYPYAYGYGVPDPYDDGYGYGRPGPGEYGDEGVFGD